MHRKCLVWHLALAGMQEMVLVTITTISSSALGSQRSPRRPLPAGDVRPLLPLAFRTGKAPQPGGGGCSEGDFWEIKSSMGGPVPRKSVI